MAKRVTPLNMTILQFIDCAVTCRVIGKKLNTKMTIKTRIEIVSTTGVNLPMLHRAEGRDWFLHRRRRMQLIKMIYDDRRAAAPKDMMALKVTDELMLVSERRDTMIRLRNKALSGTVTRLTGESGCRTNQNNGPCMNSRRSQYVSLTRTPTQ